MATATVNLGAQRQAEVLSAIPGGSVRGKGMQALFYKYEAEIEKLKLSGSIKSATILNFNPFELKVESTLVTYRVPARKPGEKYGFVTIEEPRFAFPFNGVKQANNGIDYVNDYNVMVVSPLQQAIEFYNTYMKTAQDINGGVMGGVVIFEGDISVVENAKKNTMVQVPYVKLLKSGEPFVGTEEKSLEAVMGEAQEKLRSFAMAKLQEAHEYDSDDKSRNNIVNVHRRYAQFALDQQWITEAPKWMQRSTRAEALCPRCKKEVKPDAYMCVCGKVFDAVRAYDEGDIQFNHVSFEKLDATGWKAVKKIKAQRDKMKREAGVEEEAQS